MSASVRSRGEERERPTDRSVGDYELVETLAFGFFGSELFFRGLGLWVDLDFPERELHAREDGGICVERGERCVLLAAVLFVTVVPGNHLMITATVVNVASGTL